jgi:hypothetical protein
MVMGENTRLADALDSLRDAIFETYAALAEQDRAGAYRERGEHERRQSALNFIQGEILEGRPLETFSAVHLELLETLVAYWREAENRGRGA